MHVLDFPKGKMINFFTVPKFAINQSEAVSTVLISWDIKSLTGYGNDIMATWPNVLKFAINQSEAVSTVLISWDIKSLTGYGNDIMATWPNMGTANT